MWSVAMIAEFVHHVLANRVLASRVLRSRAGSRMFGEGVY